MDKPNIIESDKVYEKIRNKLLRGIKLAKCKKCGCMIYGLNDIAENLKLIGDKASSDLINDIEKFKIELKPLEYSCLGCKHCYPAEAANLRPMRLYF